MILRALIVAAACLLAEVASAGSTFFWRMEGTTLTADDHSAGGITATPNGGVSLSPTAAAVGTKGLLTTNQNDWYTFPSAGICSITEGTFAGWFQFKIGVPASGVASFARCVDTVGQSEASLSIGNSQEIRLTLANNAGTQISLATASCNFVINSFYYVVATYHIANADRKVACYEASGVLVNQVTDLTTSLTGFAPTTFTELRVGNPGTNVNPVWVDSVHVSATYDEQFQKFAFITSFIPAYTAGPSNGTFGSTSLQFNYTANQDGTDYIRACTDGQTITTWANLKSGTCSGGASNGTGGTDTNVGGVADSATISGLTAGVNYDVFAGHESLLGGQSIIVSLPNRQTTGGAGINVTDVDTDESVISTQANVVITGTGFGASQGSGSVTLKQNGNSKTLSVDSWAATSIQVDMSGVGMGVVNGLLYGAADLRVTENGATFDELAVNLAAPSGATYVNLSGGLIPFAFDDVDDFPNRPYGDPLDLEDTSQLAIGNAVGCNAATDVVINPDATLEVNPACTAFDFDFSRSNLYVGSVATLTWRGCKPTFNGSSFPNLLFQQGIPIIPLDFSNFLTACDDPLTVYTMEVLSSTTDSTTDANGAVTAAISVIVDDASVLSDDVGKYIQCGASGTPSRLRSANPFTQELLVEWPITCADNDSILIRTVSSTSIPGLTLDASTGILSGTPTTPGSTGMIVVRGATAAGANVDTP